MLVHSPRTAVAIATAGLVATLSALHPVASDEPPKTPADAAAQANATVDATASAPAGVPVKAIEVLGQRDLPIVVTAAATKTTEVRVAARFEPPESARSVKFQTISALRGGRVVPASTFTLEAEPEASTLKLTIAVSDGAAAAGSYAVKFRASPQDPSVKPPLDLEFTLTRPPAELRLPTPLKLERVIYFPWLCRIGPGPLVVAEVSRKSSLIPPKNSWSSALRRSDNTISGRLDFDVSKPIDAGTEAIVPVSVPESPWVGTTSGTLTIVSPQLANEAIDLPFELVTRVASFWLFLVIAVGVLVGYKFRTRLEAQRLRLKALAKAQERESELDTLIKEEHDDEFRTGLERLRVTLKSACGPTAAPDAIEQAAQTAATATTELLGRKATKQAEIRNRIANLRAALGPDDDLPTALKQLRAATLSQAAEAEKALGVGQLAAAAKVADDIEAHVKRRLAKTAEDWSSSVASALDSAGPWPDTLLPASRQRFDDGLKKFGELKEDDVKGRFWALVSLETVVRNVVLAQGVRSAEREAADVQSELTRVDPTRLAALLRALGEAIKSLDSLLGRATLETIQQSGDAAHQLFNKLSEALSQAAETAPDGPLPASGLRQGKFLEVLEAVVKAHAAAQAKARKAAEAKATEKAGSRGPEA